MMTFWYPYDLGIPQIPQAIFMRSRCCLNEMVTMYARLFFQLMIDTQPGAGGEGWRLILRSPRRHGELCWSRVTLVLGAWWLGVELQNETSEKMGV